MGLSSASRDFSSPGLSSNSEQEKSSPAATPSFSRCRVGSIPVDRASIDDIARWAVNYLSLQGDVPTARIVGPNAQLVTLAEKNPRFAAAMRTADIAHPDGISVVAATHLLGAPVPERIPGSELMERLCEESARHGFSVFFLGGLPRAAELAAEKFVKKYPGFKIAGTYFAPYGFEKDEREVARIHSMIAESKPDILFVAFGVPKQEIWIWENSPALPVRLAMSVGAAFDTHAGLRKRAPKWAQRFGTEWLYRLYMEPRRLWRRYLIGNLEFIAVIVKQLLSAPRQRVQSSN